MDYHTTVLGLELHLDAPTPEQITIDDIAHGLGNTCRNAGQVRRFYAVAQHSVLVSQLVPEELALAGLLHDAAEAYLGDVPSGAKERSPGYRALEDRIMAVIAERFALPWPLPPEIKEADRVALATEYRDLVPRKGTPWPSIQGVTPDPVPIQPLSPDLAGDFFLARYHYLVSGDGEVS